MAARRAKEPTPLFDLEPAERGRRLERWRVRAGICVVAFAAFFVLWLIVGTLGMLASPLEVFGLDGLRVLAGLSVAGLMAASLILADF